MKTSRIGLMLGLVVALSGNLSAAPATLLYEDDFDRGIPGWTAVTPIGVYIDGPLRWQWDIVSQSWVEQSNVYTDAAGFSPSATALMLVNDTQAGDTYTFSARMLTGDDDGFGLVFGFQDAINFYRVMFARQGGDARRDNFPGTGWRVDRKVDDVTTLLFGSGTPGGATFFTNAVGVPFDVTITVVGGTSLSLTVVQDPEGTPLVHSLLVNETLPSSATGQVGITTWGMAGNNPRGFRISNLSLSPNALVNSPPNPLPDWEYVVPPRTTGDDVLNGQGQGIWSLSLGVNGPYGSLQENSDVFNGNDAMRELGFISPSLVAGDTGWDNYVFSTRIVSPDDDGFGIMLRYQDLLNYYRISFRRQSATIGIRRGLAVQKMVNGMYEEIYFEDPAVNFVPVANQPADVLAAINGQQLEVVVVNDPEGTPTSYYYGPLDMTGTAGIGTLANGKIGVFSWAQSLTEFDYVRVEQVSGVPLSVASPYGPADPPVGLNDFTAGSEVTASVPATVEDLPGVRRVATGFSGFGSVPASGMGNSVTFTLNNFSLLSWEWRTEFRLQAVAGAGGTVMAPPEEWQVEGTSVTLEAQASPGFIFGGWSGNTLSTAPTLSFDMTGPVSVTANFEADSDMDGLADRFEQAYFDDLDEGAGGDPDMDGATNAQEQAAGTDPTHAETLVADDGLDSPLENAQRDVALPGQFATTDFGMGYRGAWDVSNDFLGADVANVFVPNVSFDGPRMVIRQEEWDPGWSQSFTAEAIFTVGDNDGNCLYWRYQDDLNWYRVTITGEDNPATWRAPFGVSVQKRSGDDFVQLGSSDAIFTDPDDGTDPDNIAGWKRVRVRVVADGSNYTVMVDGWDSFATPMDWAGFSLVTLDISDSDHPDGRVGVGHWGQGGDPAGPTAEIPVDDGVLIEQLRVEVNGSDVFNYDWSGAPLVDEFPAGWENPYAGVAGAEGDWRMSAHGTIFQMSNFAPATTGVPGDPKADAEGPILLAPAPGVANYELRLGFHPFDNDGIGFVYDFVDTNNFARVLFENEASGPGRVPRGLNVSRRSGGVWSDIVVEDGGFIYTPGSPFAVRFSNNNGEYRLSAWNFDDPGTVASWTWQDQRAADNNRFGLTGWGMQDAHYLYAEAYDLPARAAQELRIGGISLDAGMVTLDVVNTTGEPYDVQVTTSLAPIVWSTAASNQTGDQWTGPVPAGADLAVYRLVLTQ